jgi:transcriptional regulator with XRE-family HTH domain
MNVAERFGANLVRCRKRADLSQEELGWRASLHRTEVGLLERGARIPRIDTLVKLAGALGITPNALLSGIVWAPGATISGHFLETEVSGLGTVHRRVEVDRKS